VNALSIANAYIVVVLATTCATVGDKGVSQVDQWGDPLPEGSLMRFGTVRCRHGNPATGKQISRDCGNRYSVDSVAWAPDGKTLAAVSVDGPVRIYDPCTGKHIHDLEGKGYVNGTLAFSPDGNMLATGGRDEKMRLWDAVTWKEIRCCDIADTGSSSISWAPDGRYLASTNDETLGLWNPIDGRQIRSCNIGRSVGLIWSASFWSVASSPDGKTLATTCVCGGTIYLWDSATGDLLSSLEAHRARVWSVAWSPDGRTLASASGDKTVCLWDPATCREVMSLKGHEDRVNSVAWSPDGKVLASASDDGTIRLWDPATGKTIRTMTLKYSHISSLAFSPDGQFLASGNSDSTVLIWNIPKFPGNCRTLVEADLARLWLDLGREKPLPAEQSMWTLVSSPDQTVAFLKKQLPPARYNVNLLNTIAKLIAELDSDEFAVRENASDELEKLGFSAEGQLRKALTHKPSVEANHRINELLQRIEYNPRIGLPLQTWRAVGVLERIGNRDAEQVLAALSEGDPDGRLTQEAKASLERLQRRQSVKRKE
jgi:WD40 repeat protein